MVEDGLGDITDSPRDQISGIQCLEIQRVPRRLVSLLLLVWELPQGYLLRLATM